MEMVTVTLTPIYAASFAILLVVLSVRVIVLRRRSGVAVGDGGQAALTRAVRAQANFAEYVPLALLLMLFIELGGVSDWLLHLYGLVLAAGRISHAFGISGVAENFRFRVFGMAATFTVLITAALHLLSMHLL